MIRAGIRLLITLSFCFARISFADTPDLSSANRLLNFAESAEPTLFFPPVQTQQVSGAGSDWFYRYFAGSDTYVAININGQGPYFEGDVYVLGPQFGEDLLRVDTLDNLLVAIDNIESPPMGAVNSIVNQGNGNCVPRKFPAQNDTVRFRTTTFSGNTSTITERTEFYEEVSSTKTITVIEQTNSDGEAESLASTRRTSYFESLNGMLFESENDSATTISSTGSLPSNETSNNTYAPSLFVGPSDSLCEGQEWFAAPVTLTSVSNPDLSGNGPISSQTPATVGTVDSIGEQVIVPGGAFSTVKMTLSFPDSKTIIWTDLEFGVVVMSETYQAGAESPSRIEELLQLDLPF